MSSPCACSFTNLVKIVIEFLRIVQINRNAVTSVRIKSQKQKVDNIFLSCLPFEELQNVIDAIKFMMGFTSAGNKLGSKISKNIIVGYG